MTLDDFYDLARHSVRGVNVLEEYTPTPDELALGAERPVEALIVYGTDGQALGVQVFMDHASGGELLVEVRAFDADGFERQPIVAEFSNHAVIR